MDIVLKLHSIGLPIADEYLYEFSGIPKPDNYEALLRERAEKEQAMKQALEGGERKDKPQDEGSEGEGGEGKAPKGNNPPKPKKGLRSTLSRFFGLAPRKWGADNEF